MLKESNLKLNKKIFILILALFLVDILLLNFFHTEKTLTVDKNCPADNFLALSLSTGKINFFILPGIFFLFFILLLSRPAKYEIFFHRQVSRSPPLI